MRPAAASFMPSTRWTRRGRGKACRRSAEPGFRPRSLRARKPGCPKRPGRPRGGCCPSPTPARTSVTRPAHSQRCEPTLRRSRARRRLCLQWRRAGTRRRSNGGLESAQDRSRPAGSLGDVSGRCRAGGPGRVRASTRTRIRRGPGGGAPRGIQAIRSLERCAGRRGRRGELTLKLDTPGLAFDWSCLMTADVASKARAFQALTGGGMDADAAAGLGV